MRNETQPTPGADTRALPTTTRNFTEADIRQGGIFPVIDAERSELVYAPLPWQERGLQQTASGYGGKLVDSYKISFEGKLYRLYVTCYSNAATVWFTVRGRKIVVN